MGTHPIFESDFDCLTDIYVGGMERIKRLLCCAHGMKCPPKQDIDQFRTLPEEDGIQRTSSSTVLIRIKDQNDNFSFGQENNRSNTPSERGSNFESELDDNVFESQPSVDYIVPTTQNDRGRMIFEREYHKRKISKKSFRGPKGSVSMTDIPNQIDEEDVPYIKLSKISDDESPVDFNQRLTSKNTKSMPQLAPERPFKPAHLRANKIKMANNAPMIPDRSLKPGEEKCNTPSPSKPAKLKYVSLQNQNSPNPSPSYSSTNQSVRPKISPKDQPSGGAYVTIDSEKTNEMEGLMTAA